MEARRFTREELRRCDGRAGAPAYFAYRGEVYDATASWQWRGGRHQVTHASGGDLTEDLARAPHGEDLFARLPVIGVLID
jgi:predicted heme/steroid binding protein